MSEALLAARANSDLAITRTDLAGMPLTGARHLDGGDSALRMGITLAGARTLRCEQGDGGGAAGDGEAAADALVRNRPGSVYMGALTGCWHQVHHKRVAAEEHGENMHWARCHGRLRRGRRPIDGSGNPPTAHGREEELRVAEAQGARSMSTPESKRRRHLSSWRAWCPGAWTPSRHPPAPPSSRPIGSCTQTLGEQQPPTDGGFPNY